MLGHFKEKITNFIDKRIKNYIETHSSSLNDTRKNKSIFSADVTMSQAELRRHNENLRKNLEYSFQQGIEKFGFDKLKYAKDGKTYAMDNAVKPSQMFGLTGRPQDIVFSFFAKFGFIGWQNCAILAQHWLISNACSLPVKDAIRNGWQNVFVDKDKKEESPEEKEKEQKFLTELNETANTKYELSAKLIQWVTKCNIYGIGIALPIIDGVDLEKPYNPDGIKKGSFKGISIIDPYWLTPEFGEETMTDPTNLNFYMPTYYRTANGQKIHTSHLIIIRRKEVPDILKPTYYFGGIPLTQEIYERVYAAEKSANEQPLLLLTKRLNGWKIDLNEFFANPEKYKEQIRNFTEYRDNQGVLLIDHEDDMFQIDTTLSDLDQVVMSQYKLVAAVARIPVDKLFELNPSGTLSNSGDYNIKNYNQDLNTMQNDWLKPFIDRINEIVMRSYYDRKDKIAIIFNPTDNPTAKEQADSVKAEVETLQTLIGNNVITTEEARQKLIADKDNGYSFLDEEAPEQEQDNQEIEQMLKEAQNKGDKNNDGQDTAQDEDFSDDGHWKNQPRGKDGMWVKECSASSGDYKVLDWTDKFQTPPTLKEVKEYVKELVEKGTAFETLSPDWLIDVKGNSEKRKHIVNSSKRKTMSKSDVKRHNKYIMGLKELINNSVYKNSAPNTKPVDKPDIDKYHYFISNIKIGNSEYKIILNAEQYKGEKEEKPQTVHLYDVLEKKKNK